MVKFLQYNMSVNIINNKGEKRLFACLFNWRLKQPYGILSGFWRGHLTKHINYKNKLIAKFMWYSLHKSLQRWNYEKPLTKFHIFTGNLLHIPVSKCCDKQFNVRENVLNDSLISAELVYLNCWMCHQVKEFINYDLKFNIQNLRSSNL